MEKLVYHKDSKSWKPVGSEEIIHSKSVSPIARNIKYTLDVFAVGDYAHAHVYLDNSTPAFLSASMETVLGIHNDCDLFESLYENIPESSRKSLKRFIKHSNEFFENLPPEELRHFKARFDYPYMHPKRGLRRILHQFTPFELSENGIKSQLHIFTDISYIKRSGAMSLSLIDMTGRASKLDVLQSSQSAQNKNPFSKRENEILKELYAKKSAKEIAVTLFISLDTVHNHKKRMMKKVGVKSTLELFLLSRNNGW